MSEAYIGLLVLWPLAAGLACLVLRSPGIRSALVLLTGIALAVGGLAVAASAPFAAPSALLGSETSLHIAEGAAFALPAYFLLRGLMAKHPLVIVFALGQLALAAYAAVAMPHAAPIQNAAMCDGLSLALVLVVCIVGSLIGVFAIPYMKHHEEHLHLKVSKQPGFFLILLAFLGFMNGLALSNDIRMFAAFYEATTLCSFLLIGHDKTEIATKNALRALWMNCLGGIFLHGGMLLIMTGHKLVDIHEIVNPAVWTGASMLPIALLLLAACVKAAQLPFQSWLLGAMVAPTPVSALLHSSTMVKVGVFLCLRLSPAMEGTTTGRVLALAGAFTFFATSALALGQSNAKKVLAYSTIANLGLIIACAGIATPVAIAAGVVLMVIHAATKALLFLCVGDMEQVVGSRDLEDLRGAVAKAPTTALAAAAGALAMVLPPLGMLMGKLAAIEAALANPVLLVLMALGSALAVVCWVRFSGTLLAGRSVDKDAARSSILTSGPILGLLFGAVGLGMAAPWINALLLPGTSALAGGWGLIPSLFVIAMLGWIMGMKVLSRQSAQKLAAPYIGGLPSAEPGTFVGALGKSWPLSEGNEYAEELFGEPKLTKVMSVLAVALLLALVGGAII
jgi:ech hydrogenase subunit A